MTSELMRDPVTDPLLTPQNSALVVIDYQPSQIQAVTSIDHDLLVRNIVSVARLAKTYGLPIVLSTVNVAANGQPPTIPEPSDGSRPTRRQPNGRTLWRRLGAGDGKIKWFDCYPSRAAVPSRLGSINDLDAVLWH